MVTHAGNENQKPRYNSREKHDHLPLNTPFYSKERKRPHHLRQAKKNVTPYQVPEKHEGPLTLPIKAVVIRRTWTAASLVKKPYLEFEDSLLILPGRREVTIQNRHGVQVLVGDAPGVLVRTDAVRLLCSRQQ